MDILGWKQITHDAEKDSRLFTRIHESVTRLYISKPAEYGITPDGKFIKFSEPEFEPRIYTFSDHIVMSSPCSNTGLDFLLHRALGTYGNILMNTGLCLRGSIVKGKLLDDKQVVFGPGLNYAYHLENEVANYPRILIDNSILEDSNAYRSQWESGIRESDLPLQPFRQDFDGLFHLDILSLCPPGCIPELNGPGTWGSPSYKQWMTAVREFITLNISKNHPPKIASKYHWLKNYFNLAISESNSKEVKLIQ